MEDEVMRIEMIELHGMTTRCLVIEKYDASILCENCGAITYNHKLLAKEDNDWCMNCNDKEFRYDWDDDEMFVWTVSQMAKGKAVVILKDNDEE
tara:strand:+ start:187 stop:468 length:282 start_codon:yes stop_codon:yes gene_type:complete